MTTLLQNQTTQPYLEMPIFNNWDVVTQGWYVACRSHELPKGKVKSLEVCGQRLVVFRGKDGQVRALDAYCPHMGTDLGIGQVKGNWVRCAFHHWTFDGSGQCQEIPCQTEIPSKARLQSYATEEIYGLIWVYPAAYAPHGVPEFDDLQGKQVAVWHEKPSRMQCHHHICMINGVDVHHFQTTHQFETKLIVDWQVSASGRAVNCAFTGEFPKTTLRDRLARLLIGADCDFSVRFSEGCVGLLTTNERARSLPPLYTLLAFSPTSDGKTIMQPIYIAEKGAGLWGWLKAWFMLLLTRLQFFILQGDEAIILDNMQFNPNALIDLDQQTEQFMHYVNQLEPSIWSKSMVQKSGVHESVVHETVSTRSPTHQTPNENI